MLKDDDELDGDPAAEGADHEDKLDATAEEKTMWKTPPAKRRSTNVTTPTESTVCRAVELGSLEGQE